MRYEKNSLVVEINNPVCENLFTRQGWGPVTEEPKQSETEVTEEPKQSETEVTEEPKQIETDDKEEDKVDKPTNTNKKK